MALTDNSGKSPSQPSEEVITYSDDIQLNNNYIGLNLPSITEPQVLVNDIVLQYVGDEELTPLYDTLKSTKSDERYDVEYNVSISYEVTNMPSSVSISNATIEVADNSKYDDSVIYDISDTNGKAELRFLKTGQHYYYTIELILTNDVAIKSSGEFDTAESPRIISLDGAVNVRDIGGWKTTDGHIVKQGLLYRGSELDGQVEKGYIITDTGLSDAHKYLGIVSEFDLRGVTLDSPKGSSFGASTNYILYNAYDYKNILTENGKNAMKELFSDLAVRDNYPIYMHCTYGRDRTGTACFVLEAMLGLSDYDLIREYELSCLYFKSSTPRAEDSDFSSFLQQFYDLEGKTAQDKAENYLLSCGVTKQEIESIKNILLE